MNTKITTMFALATLAGAFGLVGCAGTDPAPEPMAEVGQGWSLVWNDEFVGGDIDAQRWTFETNCWGGGNDEQQCYTDRADNAFIRDGTLVIKAQEEQFTGPAEPLEWEGSNPESTATLPYTSARLVTKDKGDWTYGRIEVRAKIPGGQGVWPAIWMMPTGSTYGPWAASGEIDIMEAVNLGTTDEAAVFGTLHYGEVFPANSSSGAKYVFDGANPTDSFHTYGIEWAAGEIRWYVDGAHYATQTQEGWFSRAAGADGELRTLVDGQPFDQDFHLLLNVAVGGAWPGSPDATTELPVEMEVDYVRVYECMDSPESLESCATVSPDAEVVKGKTPPVSIDIDYDPDFINQDVVTVFDDVVVGPYALGTYMATGTVEATVIEDEERGSVTRMQFDSDESVIYYQSNEGFDFTAFTTLSFDMKVTEDPRDAGGFQVKMDCFYPCGTGDFPLAQPVSGEWTHYDIALQDLVAFPGSTLDLGNVNTPLVIFPDYGNQDGVVLFVDNVTVSK